MAARDWIEWGALALPSLWGLASGAMLSFSRPETRKAKLVWLFGLTTFVLLATTVNFFSQRMSRTADITFDVGNGRSFVLDGVTWKFARVRVNNRSWQEATCRLYLTDIFRSGDAAPILAGDKILMSAANTGGEGYKERLIGPNNFYFFDVAYVTEADGLKIQSQEDQFLQVHPAPLLRGEYQFTIGTDGKNCSSAPYKITIRYDGWPNLSISRTAD